jgi:hypothetical protein
MESPATSHLLLFNLVALVVLGSAGSSKSDGGDAEAGLEPRMRGPRARPRAFSLLLIAKPLLVSTVRATRDLSAKGTKGSTSEDLAAAVLLELTIGVAPGSENSTDTSSG